VILPGGDWGVTPKFVKNTSNRYWKKVLMLR